MADPPKDLPRTGFHVSASGPFPEAVRRASTLGCRTFQIFCGNPRGWRLSHLATSEAAAFKEAMRQEDIRPCFVHGCYLINPCSMDRLVLDNSRRRLAAELDRTAALGADCYVLHPGSQKMSEPSARLTRAVRTIVAAVEDAESPASILLENTASSHGPGGSFRSITELMERIERGTDRAEVGLCLDTCHVFGAGYDIREAAGLQRLIEDLRATAGLERVGLIHVNDARDEAGSGRDRHQHLGEGKIGCEGLRSLLLHPALAEANVPLIAETPWVSEEKDRENLRTLRSLLTKGEI